MRLSDFKKLSINGIELKQLFINGIQAWKSGYTNLIETATAEPGGTEIYGDAGYKDDYRWSLSGKKESTGSVCRLSGWLPFTSGATYRVKNFYAKAGYNNGLYFVLLVPDGSVSAYNWSYTSPPSGVEYNSDTDTWTITVTSNKATHFRVSGYKGSNEPIITINEEIS